jgi:hypothetical protein
MNARECSRLRSIYIANNSMSMGTGQEASMQHVTQVNVVNESGFAGHELDGIYFTLRLANNTETG